MQTEHWDEHLWILSDPGECPGLCTETSLRKQGWCGRLWRLEDSTVRTQKDLSKSHAFHTSGLFSNLKSLGQGHRPSLEGFFLALEKAPLSIGCLKGFVTREKKPSCSEGLLPQLSHNNGWAEDLCQRTLLCGPGGGFHLNSSSDKVGRRPMHLAWIAGHFINGTLSRASLIKTAPK